MKSNNDTKLALGIIIGAGAALMLSSKKVRNGIKDTLRNLGNHADDLQENIKEKAEDALEKGQKARQEASKKLDQTTDKVKNLRKSHND